MPKNKSYEYRHINNPRRFKSLMFQRFRNLSIDEIHNMMNGIENDAELKDLDKEDLKKFVQTNLLRRFKDINLKTMDNNSLKELKQQIEKEEILKSEDKKKLLKSISSQRNENSRISNEEKAKQAEKEKEIKQRQALEEKEKQAVREKQQENENRNIERRQAREELNNKSPQELTNKELVERYAKQKYGYNKFLEATNNLSPETIAKRDNRRAEIKSLEEEIKKRGISSELSHEINLSRQNKKTIEAAYLSGKDFRNFSFEKWTSEENTINANISKLSKELETCFDQDKAKTLQEEIAKYKHQLEICHKNGEKALAREIENEQKAREEAKIKLEEDRVSKMEEEVARESTKIQEENTEIIDETHKQDEKGKAEEENKKGVENGERATEKTKKGFWAKVKDKVIKGWRRIAGMAGATLILIIGGKSLAKLPESHDRNPSNSGNSISEETKETQVTDFRESLKVPEPEKSEKTENLNNIENRDKQEKLEKTVKKHKMLDLRLGTEVEINENIKYSENSLGTGKFGTIGKHPSRGMGKYMIDGVALVQDGKIINSTYGIDSKFNLAEYIVKNDKEGVDIKLHLNQGTDFVIEDGKYKGAKPTGWTEAKNIVNIISKQQQQSKALSDDRDDR